MDKELALDTIKILSALESFVLTTDKTRMPAHLLENLESVVKRLSVEVLK